MKNIFKLFLLITFTFIFNNNVKADEKYYEIDTLKKDNTIIDEVFAIEINSLENIDIISKYINTKSLLINNVDIKDISFINNLPSLESIVIYYSKVNLENYNNSNIKTLKILSSYIENDDLSYLKYFKSLETLSLNNSYIKDITSIKYLTSLKELSLNSISNIKSLEPILKLKNLEKLNISGSEDLITDELFEFIKDNNIIGDNYDSNKYMYLEGKEYNEKLDEIIKSLKLDNLKTLDKIKKITLYVVNNIEYDDNCGTSKGCTNSEIEFNYVAIALAKKGICYHYALLENKLLNKAGIDSYIVTGVTHKGLGHAWVNIYLNNKWYAIDPTWIDFNGRSTTLKNTSKTDYYMIDLSNETLKNKYNKEHIANVVPMDIVDVNGKYIDKEEVLITPDMYKSTYIVFIVIIVLFVLYFIRNNLRSKKKKYKRK